VIKFGLRHGNDFFNYYMEKLKLKNALEIPNKSFIFMKKSVTGIKDSEHTRWIKQQLSSRLSELK